MPDLSNAMVKSVLAPHVTQPLLSAPSGVDQRINVYFKSSAVSSGKIRGLRHFPRTIAGLQLVRLS